MPKLGFDKVPSVFICLHMLLSSGLYSDDTSSISSPFFGKWTNPINVGTNAQTFNPLFLKDLPTNSFLHGGASQYHELGVYLFYGTGIEQNYAAARRYFNIAVSQGYEDSKYFLGVMYLYGLGVIKDEVIAARFFYEAAIKGNSPCQYQYGMCLKNGIGIPKNLIKASSMFLKAAEQGHSDAQCEIGIAYHYGYGVPADDAQSIYWFYKSAIQGNISARQNIEEMSKTSKEAKEALDRLNVKTIPRKLPTHRPKNRVDTNSIVCSYVQ